MKIIYKGKVITILGDKRDCECFVFGLFRKVRRMEDKLTANILKVRLGFDVHKN